MLAVTTYPQDYIDECRAAMAAQLSAYRAVVAATSADEAGRSALAAFEPVFFGNLVLVLDQYFVHRTRAIEGKDGNPLNEVRMLAASILRTGRVLAADKTIKYKPDAAVLGLAVGDEITLDDARFVRLSEAFFAEIEQRFT